MPNFDAAIFKISIHALREEGDDELQRYVREQAISIHALREEGDVRLIVRALASSIFLSTPSARRATEVEDQSVLILVFLSTPSARRATRFSYEVNTKVGISIHALREEGDLRCAASKGGSFSISIHALREEGDSYQPSRSTIP